ncbi:MAG TPA: class IV adenylate cyclase [Bryobacterales bacterium]|nr:class IV adenylate cyclase [Bryobacterales bacterium]
MQETEIKLRIASPAAMRRRLRGLGFHAIGPRQLERNLVFDTSDGALRNRQQLLRLRSKGRRWWLTWKGRPASDSLHKVREEIEVELGDGAALEDILRRLGFCAVFQYEKYRTEFRQRGQRSQGHLLLDETPIGNFIELEGPPRWIDRIAAELGYKLRDYVVASYGALYLAYCREQGLPAGDMVFPRRAGPRPRGKS